MSCAMRSIADSCRQPRALRLRRMCHARSTAIGTGAHAFGSPTFRCWPQALMSCIGAWCTSMSTLSSERFDSPSTQRGFPPRRPLRCHPHRRRHHQPQLLRAQRLQQHQPQHLGQAQRRATPLHPQPPHQTAAHQPRPRSPRRASRRRAHQAAAQGGMRTRNRTWCSPQWPPFCCCRLRHLDSPGGGVEAERLRRAKTENFSNLMNFHHFGAIRRFNSYKPF